MSLNFALKELDPLDYPQVAEWEFGPQVGVDWARYTFEMSLPKWRHYGLYLSHQLVGCVSLEKRGTTAIYHVVTARHKLHPNFLAQTLLNIAGHLFENGFAAVSAHIPIEKRAGARLALRCGMREIGHDQKLRYFILTKSRYLKNGR